MTEFNNEVYKIFLKHEQDFVPPLSERGSVEEYYLKLKDEDMILLRHQKKLIGVITFYRKPSIIDESKEVLYIANLIVDREYRGNKIAYKLYDMCFACCGEGTYEIRTWSTNEPQQHILNNLGFKLIKRIKDDRGEGIDTLFYQIDIKRQP